MTSNQIDQSWDQAGWIWPAFLAAAFVVTMIIALVGAVVESRKAKRYRAARAAMTVEEVNAERSDYAAWQEPTRETGF